MSEHQHEWIGLGVCELCDRDVYSLLREETALRESAERALQRLMAGPSPDTYRGARDHFTRYPDAKETT